MIVAKYKVVISGNRIMKGARFLMNEGTAMFRDADNQMRWHGGTMVSSAASQRQGRSFDSQLGSLSVRNLHVLPVSAWVSSGCSGFLPHS